MLNEIKKSIKDIQNKLPNIIKDVIERERKQIQEELNKIDKIILEFLLDIFICFFFRVYVKEDNLKKPFFA